MNDFGILILFIIIGAMVLGGHRRSTLSAKVWPFQAAPLMTPVEQIAYRRLRMALPNHLIFSQVQLIRFLRVKRGAAFAWHSRIAQLSADFVVCRPDSSVIAVIEIDDASHERPKQRARDAKKDRACAAANIPVLRWKARQLPDENIIQAQFAAFSHLPQGIRPQSTSAAV